MTAPGGQTRHRWSVAAQVVAGTLGAYSLASLITVAVSLLLARFGMNRVEAVTAATLASFAVFATLSMAAFHARSAMRAWLWLIGISLPVGLVVLALLPGTKG